MSRVAVLGLALGVALLVSACGSTEIVGSSVSPQVKHELSARGIPVKSVACPDAPNKTGTSFACKVSGRDGSSASIKVTIVDAKARRFRYPFRFVRTTELAQLITSRIWLAAHVHAHTACTQIVLLPETGAKVTCEARGPAGFHRRVYAGVDGAGRPTTARFVNQ